MYLYRRITGGFGVGISTVVSQAGLEGRLYCRIVGGLCTGVSNHSRVMERRLYRGITGGLWTRLSWCRRRCKKPVKPRVTVQVVAEGGAAALPRPISIICAVVVDGDERSIMLAYGSSLNPTFEKLVGDLSSFVGR